MNITNINSPSQRFLRAVAWGEDTTVKELSIEARLTPDQTLQQLVYFAGECMLRVRCSDSEEVINPIDLVGHNRRKIFLRKSKKLAALLAQGK